MLYYSGSDARIRFLNHPDDVFNFSEADIAHFSLTAGQGPVHIWNYTYRDSEYVPQGLQKGHSGGALYDDTALGTRFVQLQLIVNTDRFRSTFYQYAPLSRIGDVEIRYESPSSWDEQQTTGYRLIDGHIGQTAEDITVGTAIYKSVMLVFQDIKTLQGVRPVDEQTAPHPEAHPERDENRLFVLRTYQAVVQTGDLRVEYHPDAYYDGPVRVVPRLDGPATHQLTVADAHRYIRECRFMGAFLELQEDAETTLYMWNNLLGHYAPIARSKERSVIQDATLSPDRVALFEDNLTGAVS